MRSTPKKALLKVGYACNNNCAFCHSAPHRGQDSPLHEILRKIELARRLGARMMVLSGGEPTIRSDLPKITSAIQAQGLKLGLVTNGRMLAYPRLAEQLIDRGLGYAYVSVCGPNPEIHDRHTLTESFNQTLQGLGNLSGKIEDLTINTVITSWNLPQLQRMVDLASEVPGARLKLSMLEPEGSALDDFDRLSPPMPEAADAACRAAAATAGTRPLLDGFPLCLVPEELRGLESGLREDGFFIMSEAFEPDWFPVDDANRAFGDRCLSCSLRRKCRGVYRQYLARRGEDELRPETRPVSNSFNFEPEADPLLDLDLENCPIRAGQRPPPDPVRGVLVSKSPGRFQLYQAPTRDFSDDTIGYSIRQQGQIYLSRSGDQPTADIKDDLERLRMADTCRQCPQRSLCGGAWLPTGEDGGFGQFTDRLAGELAALSGSVLDIGCGPAPYLDALADRLSSGAATYLGIDPGEGPPELPDGARFRRSSLTDFDWTGEPFDNLLALRSLNHLASLPESLDKIASLTVPGGKVLLADDEVFGVVRKRAALESIKAGMDLPFEHLTNLRLDEARQLAQNAGLRPQKWLSAGESHCPTWLLECRRESR